LDHAKRTKAGDRFDAELEDALDDTGLHGIGAPRFASCEMAADRRFRAPLLAIEFAFAPGSVPSGPVAEIGWR
jgi:hypothetical protein